MNRTSGLSGRFDPAAGSEGHPGSNHLKLAIQSATKRITEQVPNTSRYYDTHNTFERQVPEPRCLKTWRRPSCATKRVSKVNGNCSNQACHPHVLCLCPTSNCDCVRPCPFKALVLVHLSKAVISKSLKSMTEELGEHSRIPEDNEAVAARRHDSLFYNHLRPHTCLPKVFDVLR